MIVITGASGNIGKVIAENLLKQGQKVRVIARHKDSLKDLEKKGAESFPGNLEDASFLAKAFHGATAVFAMNPSNLQAEDPRKHQETVANALASAISQAEVQRVVNLSSIGGELPKGTGPIAGLHYQEEKFNELKQTDILHLRPTYFMENFLMNLGMIKNMGINGSPLKADLMMPMIATIDIGKYAAKRFQASDWKGKTVQDLLGQRDLNMNEATKIFGKAIGKPHLSYVQFSYKDALQGLLKSGLTPGVAEKFVEMIRAFNEGLIQSPRRTPENTTPTTIEEFAENVFAPAFQHG